MNPSMSARAVRRVLFLIAFLFLAAYVSVPANAVTCALSFDAPTGGGDNADPIQATGRIVCSSTVLIGGAVVNAYLLKDNTTISQASQNVTGHSNRTLPLSAPCSPGNWQITVTGTVPGATLNQPAVSSQSIPFICERIPPPGAPVTPTWTGGWDACTSFCISMGAENLTWDASGPFAPTYYHVERSDNFGSTWVVDAAPISASTVVVVPYGAVRYFRVAACNAAGCSNPNQRIILYYDPNP